MKPGSIDWQPEHQVLSHLLRPCPIWFWLHTCGCPQHEVELKGNLTSEFWGIWDTELTEHNLFFQVHPLSISLWNEEFSLCPYSFSIFPHSCVHAIPWLLLILKSLGVHENILLSPLLEIFAGFCICWLALSCVIGIKKKYHSGILNYIILCNLQTMEFIPTVWRSGRINTCISS